LIATFGFYLFVGSFTGPFRHHRLVFFFFPVRTFSFLTEHLAFFFHESSVLQHGASADSQGHGISESSKLPEI
jgi:hypothetical protein